MNSANELQTIWLRRWDDDPTSRGHLEILREKYDVPVSDAKTADELMQLWATRRVGCWAIMNSVEFVGVTQFGPTDPHPEFYQPGTFILPEYRGRDVNTILKNATVKAFARMGDPLRRPRSTLEQALASGDEETVPQRRARGS